MPDRGEPFTEQEISDAMARHLAASGIHPAIVYAFEKCEYLVTEFNRHLFNDDQLEAWDEAVLEGMGVLGLWDDESE